MKMFCSWCGKRLKWYAIILWGDFPCDECYLKLNQPK